MAPPMIRPAQAINTSTTRDRTDCAPGASPIRSIVVGSGCSDYAGERYHAGSSTVNDRDGRAAVDCRQGRWKRSVGMTARASDRLGIRGAEARSLPTTMRLVV